MPNTTAAKKALRQTVKRTARNLTKKKYIKEALKAVEKAIANEPAAVAELLKKVHALVDKAAKSNTIHKNKAARIKSRLQQRVNKLTK